MSGVIIMLSSNWITPLAPQAPNTTNTTTNTTTTNNNNTNSNNTTHPPTHLSLGRAAGCLGGLVQEPQLDFGRGHLRKEPLLMRAS